MGSGRELYARVDVDFYLGDSESGQKFRELPASARDLYLVLWCMGLKQRRETMRRMNVDYLASRAGCSASDVRRNLLALKQKDLIKSTRNSITMTGLRAKHPKLLFKDLPYGDDIESNGSLAEQSIAEQNNKAAASAAFVPDGMTRDKLADRLVNRMGMTEQEALMITTDNDLGYVFRRYSRTMTDKGIKNPRRYFLALMDKPDVGPSDEEIEAVKKQEAK